jgi:hypothetical protein
MQILLPTQIKAMASDEYFGAAACEQMDDKYDCIAASTADGKRQCYYKQRAGTCHPLNRSAATVVNDLEKAHTGPQRRRAFKRMQRLLALTKFNQDFAFADVGNQVAEVIASDKRLQRIVKQQIALEAKESNDATLMKFVKYGIPAIIAVAGLYYGWDQIMAFLTKFWSDNTYIKGLRDMYNLGVRKAGAIMWAYKHGAPVPRLGEEHEYKVKIDVPPGGLCDEEFCVTKEACIDVACEGCAMCKMLP